MTEFPSKLTVKLGDDVKEADDSSKLILPDGVAENNNIMDMETATDDLLVPPSSREATRGSRSRDSEGVSHSSHHNKRAGSTSKRISSQNKKYSKKSERHSSRRIRHQSGDIRQSSSHRRRGSERPPANSSADRRRTSKPKHSSTRPTRRKSFDDTIWESTHEIDNDDGRRSSETDGLQNMKRRISKEKSHRRRSRSRSRSRDSDHDLELSESTEVTNALCADHHQHHNTERRISKEKSQRRRRRSRDSDRDHDHNRSETTEVINTLYADHQDHNMEPRISNEKSHRRRRRRSRDGDHDHNRSESTEAINALYADHQDHNTERRISKEKTPRRRRRSRDSDRDHDHNRSETTEVINTLYADHQDHNMEPRISKEKSQHRRRSRDSDHAHDRSESMTAIEDQGAKAKMKSVEHIGSKSNRTKNTLYGNDSDAKAKAMGASYQRATNPGVEQVDSSKTDRSIHTLYGGSDADAKAKAKASILSSEPARTPGVHQVSSTPAGISASSKHSTATSTLSDPDALFGSDADAKPKAASGNSEPAAFPGVDRVFSPTSSPIWQKAKLSRGNLEQKPSPSATTKTSRTINTLYGDDVVADTKAKAKASRGSDESATIPGAETVTVCDSTYTAISTLYGGGEAESKVKARVSRGLSHLANNPGAESVAESDRTDRTVGTLYGYDAYAKAKYRVGSSLLAAFPGVERLRMRSPSASNSPDEHTETEVQQPVARRIVSTGSTDSESESLSGPVRKSMTSEAMEGFQMPNDPETGPEQSGSLKKKAVVEDTSARSRKKRKKRMVVLLLFLLLLLIGGGGAAVWYFLFRNNSSGGETGFSANVPNIQDRTESPSSPIAPSFSPTEPSAAIDTTFSPSAPPSRGLTYRPPSEFDCQAIAANQTIAGREEMENADFELGMEVVLSENTTLSEPILQELLDAIQRKILPSLAGCSVIIDEVVEAWRFVIFDAFVTGRVPPGESCTDEALMQLNCHRVSVKLNLFLKGAVRFLDIIALISDEGENIANHLELEDTFSVIKLIGAESLIPTEAPTRMPSDAPSFSPTEFPTVLASSNPTGIPSVLPTRATTGEPSLFPTIVPSEAPSMVPSTSTTAPTAVPSTQPTGVPSESPSVRPTIMFSGSPTLPPTPAPSAIPSRAPSAQPSARPSTRPSRSPTPAPSASPTVSPAPSTSPSSMPSTTPSVAPSRLPSSAPSAAPTITSFHWVTCGRRGRCSGPASSQNSNYDKIGGTGSEIAIRCCSDTLLPGFTKRYTSCPYVKSDIGGVCYESVTHHEATALCAGVGARLCTQAELDGNCSRGSGCGHDKRWIWTSDPGP